MKRLILASLAVLALAAAPDPVVWKLADAPSRTVKPGGHFTVNLDAKIQPGWHMYSLKPVANGPVATRIWIGEGQPFVLSGAARAPEPLVVQDPSFNMEVETYEGEVSFTLPVRVAQTTNPGTNVLLVNASYQTCDNRVCLPPKTIKLSLPIEVAR